MEKKRKWERDYESYQSSTELDERIADLEYSLKQPSGLTKEEYSELKKLTAIKANLPKVKNILELRTQLMAEKEQIQKAIEIRQQLVQKSKETLLLEYKLNGTDIEKDGKKVHIEGLLEKREALSKKLSELNAKIANPDLDPAEKTKLKAEKTKLQGEISENDSKIQDNNKEFGNNQEKIKEYQEVIKNSKFKEISLEDLKTRTIQISSNISECSIACNKLMQGYSWQSVEVALNKYEAEKLTAKGKNAAKMKQNREAAKAANAKDEKSKTEAAKVETTKSDSVKAEPAKVEKTIAESKAEKQEETALEVPTRWQKIKGWAKNLWEKWFVEEVEDEEVKEDKGDKEEKDQGESPKKKSIFTRIKEAYNKFMEKEEPEETKKEENKKEETKKEETSKTEEEKKEETTKVETKADSFRQYLKDVAEKGIDGVEKEKADAEKAAKEARMQAAREKLQANRAGKDTGAIITNLDKELNGKNDDAR